MAVTAEKRTTHAEKLAQRSNLKAAQSVATRPTPPAYISDFETYRPSEVKLRLKLGRDWLTEARKNGLRVIIEANKILIRGRTLNRYFAKREREQSQ